MASRLVLISKRLLQIITGFIRAKKRYRLPQHTPILILDDVNYQFLVPLFRNQPYMRVDLTGKEIYCAPGFLWEVLCQWLSCHELKVAYVLALLKRNQPSIVVTYIDNSGIFQRVAQLISSPAMRFLAIQNGNRLLERDHPPGSPQIYLKEFACLGRYEIDQYTQHGAHVERFYPVGMLLDSYYRETHPTPPQHKDFDICLVSQVRPGLLERHTERMDSFILLAEYVKQFCQTYKKTVCVAMRMHPERNMKMYQWERAWYEQYLGKEAQLFPNTPNAFNTYELTDRSRVSVGMHSTSMREAFGRGNRILSCNFSGHPVYNFQFAGPWALNVADYQMFETQLKYLLELEDTIYTALSKEAISYLMGYSSEVPTHHFLANLIAEAIHP